MPRWSRELRDANGKWLGRVCGREPYRKCSVPECREHAPYLCDFPTKGKAMKGRRSGSCDRAMCERHRTKVGANRDFCPPHARADGTDAEQLTLPAAAELSPPFPGACRHCGKPIPPGEAYSALPYDPKTERVVRLPGAYHGACATTLAQLMRIPCDE